MFHSALLSSSFAGQSWEMNIKRTLFEISDFGILRFWDFEILGFIKSRNLKFSKSRNQFML